MKLLNKGYATEANARNMMEKKVPTGLQNAIGKFFIVVQNGKFHPMCILTDTRYIRPCAEAGISVVGFDR